ncbi:MAG: hypothetical protein U0V49_03490 [Saprospiraceae bacterium]
MTRSPNGDSNCLNMGLVAAQGGQVALVNSSKRTVLGAWANTDRQLRNPKKKKRVNVFFI